MNSSPPLPGDRRRIDSDHLNLLSIFYFVSAGLALLGLLFLFAHYTFFHFFISDPGMWQGPKQTPPPALFFAMFRWFYVVMAAWFVASAALNVVSGIFLRARKHWTFSLVVAAIDCLHFPLGTILGVFTIIVLIRPSVRELYGDYVAA